MDMTTQRWDQTSRYLQEVFGREDPQLATLMQRAIAAGIPNIAVSSEVGRLLHLLTTIAREGKPAQLAIEVGTLAGYSGLWIARGLATAGRLVTIELEPRHADFAQAEFTAAGLADRVEIRRGSALDILAQLRRELPPKSVDLAFLDAVKVEYEQYWHALRPLIRPGGFLLADNVLGSDSWWIDQPQGQSPDRDAIDRFNRTVAADPDFEAAAVPIRQGVMIASKRA